MLRAEGFVVHSASDGASALRILEETPPNLMVVDLLMPGMHGEAFLRQVRQRSAAPDAPYIPIIMMTALRGWAQRDASGADAFLEKPFAIDALLGTVELTLYRHRG